MSEEKKPAKHIRWSEGFRRPEPDDDRRSIPRRDPFRKREGRAKEGEPFSKRRESRPPRREGSRGRGWGERPDFVIRRDRPTAWEKPAEPAAEPNVQSWVRRMAALKTEKGRDKEQRFLVDGVRCVEEIARYSASALVKVVTAPGFQNPELMGMIKKLGVEVEELSREEIDYLSTTVTHQGIVAICNQAVLRPKWETAKLVTLVDSVQDPGNLGAIFRTSLAFGMDALLLGSGTVDPFNPKVVRGSSGTMMRVPFETGCDLAEKYQFLRSKGFTIVATSPHARQELDNIKMRRKVAFLVGNEGAGADQRLIDAADVTVRIPMSHSLESLNVAVAHGILSAQLWQMRDK